MMSSSFARITPWRKMLACALLALAACGGGVETGGTGTGAYVQGPIGGFGSVIVAGVRFDDAAALIEDRDGGVRSRDDLRLGMLVEVESGPIVDDGSGGRAATATRVRLAGGLLGPVTALDPAGVLLGVLGQPVRLTAATVVEGVAGGAAGLQLGDVVEVHGFFAPLEGYVATRLERRSTAPASYRVRGVVSALDGVARTLRIGTQVFDLGTVAVPAGLVIGDFVRISVLTARVSGRWAVISVALDATSAGDRADAELEGLISAFTSAAQFSVNGVRVDASHATFIDNSAGLGEGVRVKVSGRSEGGTLIAATVDIRSDADAFGEGVDIRDQIASVDGLAKTFVVRGETVFYGQAPELKDGTLDNIVAGQRVRVRAVLSADRTRLVATRIEFVKN